MNLPKDLLMEILRIVSFKSQKELIENRFKERVSVFVLPGMEISNKLLYLNYI